jgi:hypothetical protein
LCGDSGTFADRMMLEGYPLVPIEGMTIASIAVGATQGYIYVRSEYPHGVAAAIGLSVWSRCLRRRRLLCAPQRASGIPLVAVAGNDGFEIFTNP